MIAAMVEASLPEIDGVHIRFKDLILVHLFLDLQCKVLLLKLSLDTVVKCLLIHKVRKDIVLDELLCDCAGALGKGTARDTDDSGPDDSLEVDSVVVIEALVLDRHKGISHVLGNLFKILINPVGI